METHPFIKVAGAGDRTRTGTDRGPWDFKSQVSTVPPPRHRDRIIKAHISFSSGSTDNQSVNNDLNLLYEPFFILHIYYIIFFYKNQISLSGWGGGIRTHTARVRAWIPAVLETVFLPLEYSPMFTRHI